MSRRVITDSEPLDYVQAVLSDDGKNLAQYLFNLKNSSSLKRRQQFRRIQEGFATLFKAERLTFDVIVNEEYDQDSNKVPKSISIVIIDEGLGKQFLLSESGAGITEALFLLTIVRGLTESVILLDEPSINLHTTLLKSIAQLVMTTETDRETNNQFITITQSPELVDYLLFELSADIFSIQRTDGNGSIIKSLNEQTKSWIDQTRPKLRYCIDTRLFFAKKVVLTEGEADTYFAGAAEYFSSVDPSLNLDRNDIQIIGVRGKNNFPKYRKLISAFEIPSVLIGDKDILNERENEIAKIFESHTLVTKERINGDTPDIFILGEGEKGDLEDFMKAIDNDTYEEIQRTVNKDYGRAASKPVIAFEFFKKVGSETPEKIGVISDLIRRIIDL